MGGAHSFEGATPSHMVEDHSSSRALIAFRQEIDKRDKALRLVSIWAVASLFIALLWAGLFIWDGVRRHERMRALSEAVAESLPRHESTYQSLIQHAVRASMLAEHIDGLTTSSYRFVELFLREDEHDKAHHLRIHLARVVMEESMARLRHERERMVISRQRDKVREGVSYDMLLRVWSRHYREKQEWFHHHHAIETLQQGRTALFAEKKAQHYGFPLSLEHHRPFSRILVLEAQRHKDVIEDMVLAGVHAGFDGETSIALYENRLHRLVAQGWFRRSSLQHALAAVSSAVERLKTWPNGPDAASTHAPHGEAFVALRKALSALKAQLAQEDSHIRDVHPVLLSHIADYVIQQSAQGGVTWLQGRDPQAFEKHHEGGTSSRPWAFTLSQQARALFDALSLIEDVKGGDAQGWDRFMASSPSRESILAYAVAQDKAWGETMEAHKPHAPRWLGDRVDAVLRHYRAHHAKRAIETAWHAHQRYDGIMHGEAETGDEALRVAHALRYIRLLLEEGDAQHVPIRLWAQRQLDALALAMAHGDSRGDSEGDSRGDSGYKVFEAETPPFFLPPSSRAALNHLWRDEQRRAVRHWLTRAAPFLVLIPEGTSHMIRHPTATQHSDKAHIFWHKLQELHGLLAHDIHREDEEGKTAWMAALSRWFGVERGYGALCGIGDIEATSSAFSHPFMMLRRRQWFSLLTMRELTSVCRAYASVYHTVGLLEQRFARYVQGRYPFSSLEAKDVSLSQYHRFFRFFQGRVQTIQDAIDIITPDDDGFLRHVRDVLSSMEEVRALLGMLTHKPLLVMMDSGRVEDFPHMGRIRAVTFHDGQGQRAQQEQERGQVRFHWQAGQSVALTLHWHEESPWIPVRGASQGHRVSFQEEGGWALLRFYERYAMEQETAMTFDHHRTLLRFPLTLGHNRAVPRYDTEHGDAHHPLFPRFVDFMVQLETHAMPLGRLLAACRQLAEAFSHMKATWYDERDADTDTHDVFLERPSPLL